jgi:glycosyltransferase involved in cell wall biosynthesis
VSLFYNRNPEGVIYPSLDITKYRFSKDKEKFALVILKRGYLSHVEMLEKIAERIKVKVVGAKIPNAEYLGDRVSDEELKDLYSRAAVTLYPMDFEYFGYIPLESMASGTPVIAFKYSGGPSETIVDGKTGWLVSNEKEFYETAIKVVENNYSENINKNCRERAKEFSVEIQSERLIENIINMEKGGS